MNKWEKENEKHRVFNALKVTKPKGNTSWVGKVSSINELIKICNSGKNIRKTCDLHFYTWIDKGVLEHSPEFLGTVADHHPKESQIPEADIHGIGVRP